MVSKPGKPKSKRTPVRLRHKIEKASAAKQRKQRKQAKKVGLFGGQNFAHSRMLTRKQNPEWRSRLKKDPGIPNLFPYKERLLHEIEEKKRIREEENSKRREENRRAKNGPDKLESEHHTKMDDDADDNDDQDEDEGSDLLDEESMDEDVDEDQDGQNTDPMAALVQAARARAKEYAKKKSKSEATNGNDFLDEDEDDDSEEDSPADFAITESLPTGYKMGDSSRKAFDKIYKNVLDSSDIILYVLDARDPNGTRSREIEREVLTAAGGSKRLILILNKIDLVPPPVLKAWLQYLRRSFPTLPLRASMPASNARIFDHKALTVKGTSETLLRALKSYAQSKNLKRSTSVGIIGYPNVGKSSVVNALTSRLAGGRPSSTIVAPTGAEAGVTTSLRQIKLDNRLKLLDSPGIVFSPTPSSADVRSMNESTSSAISTSTNSIYPPHMTTKQAHDANLVLLSALPPSAIRDPVPAVTLLLHRLMNDASGSTDSGSLFDEMLSYYNIAPNTLVTATKADDTTTDFLVQVSRKRGRLGKGGVPNINAAAMTVLVDWRDGRIRGWQSPPSDPTTDAHNGDSAVTRADTKDIVSEWGKEFKLDGLWGDEHDDAEMSDGASIAIGAADSEVLMQS